MIPPPSPVILPLSPEFQKAVVQAHIELPDINTVIRPSSKTGLYFSFSPAAQTRVAEEAEKLYQKITGIAKPHIHVYMAIWFHGFTSIAVKYSALFVPLVLVGSSKIATMGYPKIEELDNVSWDGSQCLYLSEEIILRLSEADRAGGLVIYFSKDD